jgi:hypothetical protein
MTRGPEGVHRPRSVTAIGSILIGLGVLAIGIAAVGAVSSLSSGYAWMAAVLVVLPATFAGLALAGGFGMLAGARWGWWLGIAAAAAVIAGGVWLVITALMEWDLPGSFAALRLPPAAVALLVGGVLVYGLIASRAYFSAPPRE